MTPRMLPIASRFISAAAVGLLVFSSLATAEQGGGTVLGGLRGDYFANGTFSGAPQFSRSDVRLDFNESALSWAGSNGWPSAGFPADHFSVRWSGRIIARFSETYTLRSFADAVRVRLKLPGAVEWTTVIDDWPGTDRAPDLASGTFAFTAGQAYDMVVDYREGTGTQALRLAWEAPSVLPEVIEPVAQMAINQGTYVEQTFADAIKSGRSTWEPVSPAAAVPMDAHDWPMANCDFIVSETLTPYQLSPMELGDMTLRLQGRVQSLTVFGNGIIVPGSIHYDMVTNTTTALVRGQQNEVNVLNLRFRGTDRDGDYGPDGQPDNDGFTNLSLMRVPGEGSTEALPFGTLTHPKFREAFDRMTALRFQRTNDQARDWSQRTQPTSAFSMRGLPYVFNSRYNGGAWNLYGSCQYAHEIEIQICNELGCDYYLTVPHLATDSGPDPENYLLNLARLIRYGSDANGTPYSATVSAPVHPPLNPNLRVHLEIANELWNFGALGAYAPFYDYRELMEDLQSSAHPDFAILNYDSLPLNRDGSGYLANSYTFVRRYWALRLARMSNVFRGVFGDSAMPGNGNRAPRIRPYFTWQYGNANDTARVPLEFMEGYFNNAAMVATPHPANYYFWSGGGAGYYSSTNPVGTVADAVTNGSVETPAVSTWATAPGTANWSFTGNAGLASNAIRNANVTSATPGAVNSTAGWVGGRFTVGAAPVTVYELGRWVLSGNSVSHEVRLVRASDGVEVTQATVNTQGATPGQFAYGRCVPVLLQANTSYYLLSYEASDAVAGSNSTVTAAGLSFDFPATATLNGTAWTFANGSGAGTCWGPVSLRTETARLLPSGTALNNPDTMSTGGAQAIWLQSSGGTQSSASTSFTIPPQTDTHYSLAFRWAARCATRAGVPDAPFTRIHVSVNGSAPVEISPVDVNTQPAAWNPYNEWRRVSYWIGDLYFSEVFSAPSGANVTVTFSTSAPGGDHVAFVDEVQLTSADAFYAGDIPSTGTAFGQTGATYEYNQLLDGQWCAAFGLTQMTYEHGFSAGGDSGNSPLQNYAKFTDPRARQTVNDAMNIFQRSGGHLPTLGTYSTWPAFETISGSRVDGVLNSGSWPLTQGVDDVLSRLSATPTNGTGIPGVIAGANDTLTTGSNGGATLAAGQWSSYQFVVTQPRVYGLGVLTAAAAGGAQVQLWLDGTLLSTSAAGALSSTTAYLGYGTHALRVRSASGTFNIGQVLFDNANLAPVAPSLLSAQVNTANLQISLNWQDHSTGDNQELWFEIDRATDAAFTQNVSSTTVAANSTSWTDVAQLPVAVTYYYRVRAVNLVAASAYAVTNVYLSVPSGLNRLFAYDPVDAPGTTLLHGLNDGTGWSSAWNVQNNDTVTPGWQVLNTLPLTYPNLVTSGTQRITGGRVFLTAGRVLDLTGLPYYLLRGTGSNTRLGADGTSVWISVLARPDRNISGTFLALTPNPTAFVSSDWRAGVTAVNGNWAVLARQANGSMQIVSTNISATVGQTALLVLKAEFGATDVFRLFVNPAQIGGPAPGSADAVVSAGVDCTFHTIAFSPSNDANGGSTDEWRIGESFAAVTPPVVTPLQAWRQSNFGTVSATGNAANDADPDNDGIANLGEFLFGLNPLQPDASDALVYQGGTLRFRRVPGRYGSKMDLETSNDLVSWSVIGTSQDGQAFALSPNASATAAESGDNPVDIRVTPAVPPGNPATFWRIRCYDY